MEVNRYKSSRGRPRRRYTVEEVQRKVDDLRGELRGLLEKQVAGTATIPSLNEREILRVSRALRREEILLQNMLSKQQMERMF